MAFGWLAFGWLAGRNESGGAGLGGPGQDGSETGEDAGQAVPDADDLWAGHARAEASDDDGAEGIDHRDEAVGGGKGYCREHEQNKNINRDECQWDTDRVQGFELKLQPVDNSTDG